MRTFVQRQKPTQEAKSASSAKPGRAFSGQRHEIRSILHLQRMIGNQAVQRLAQSNAEEHEAGSAITASTRLSYDFSQIPVYASGHSNIQPNQQHAQSFTPAASQLSSTPFSGLLQHKCSRGGNAGSSLTGECEECRRERFEGEGPSLVQSKLRIGEPGDEYEQEADRIANQAMHSGNAHLSSDMGGASLVQRQCAACADGGALCPQCAGNREEHIMLAPRSAYADDTAKSSASTPHGYHGGGFPLPRAERSFFESSFGHDFSNVRIHADAKASATAETLRARAFTHGQNIYFGHGQYQPRSHEGRHLIAHELVHTLQQRRIPSRIQCACNSLKTIAGVPAEVSGRCDRRNPIDCCPEEDTGCKKLSTAEGAYSRALAKVERAISRLDAAPDTRKEDDEESARLAGRAAERYFGIDTTVRRKRGRKAVQQRESVTQALRPLRATLGRVLAHMQEPAKLAREQTPPEKEVSEKEQDISQNEKDISPESEPRPVPEGGVPGGVPGGAPGLPGLDVDKIPTFKLPEPCQSSDYQIMCGFEPCEGGCFGNNAFFRPSSKRIVLCDRFFYDLSPLQQEATIIHEVAHSVLHPDKLDIYSESRLFPLLGTVKRSSKRWGTSGVAALDNPDSIAAFVLLGRAELEEDDRVHRVIGRVESAIRDPVEDSFGNAPLLRRKAERQKAQVTLARGLVDEKIREASKLTARLASNIDSAKSWDLLAGEDKATLALLRGDTGIHASDCDHTRFPGLAKGRCPWANLSASPTNDDIRIIKAIWENLDTLRSASAINLTIDMDATSRQWDAAANRLSLTKQFFEASDEDRVSLLIEMVVASNPRIGSFAPDYMSLLELFSIL